MSIQIDQLAAAVNRQLAAFAGATDEIVQKATDDIARATVQQLKATSPKATGAYSRSWKSTKLKSSRHEYSRVIHAGDGEYRLTHLLEKGHNVVRGGKVVGRAKAYPHIADAEQKAITDFEAEIRRKVEEISR